MPDEWKRQIITPIPKGSPSLNSIDYRPVSVLIAPRKMIEKVVRVQMDYYHETNALLNRIQHDYGDEHGISS